MIDEDIDSIEDEMLKEKKKKRGKSEASFLNSSTNQMQGILLEILKALIVIFITILIILFFLNKREIITTTNAIETSYKGQDVVNIIPEGSEWEMDEMMINTADSEYRHFARIKIVVSYEKDNLEFARILKVRKNQIYSEIRKLIASKTYGYLKSVENQESLRMEIKKELQLIVRKAGLIEIFIVDFTLH